MKDVLLFDKNSLVEVFDQEEIKNIVVEDVKEVKDYFTNCNPKGNDTFGDFLFKYKRELLILR